MLHEIKNVQDVVTFLETISEELQDFNPFIGFKYYRRPNTDQDRYTSEEAEIRDRLLERCFEVCKGKSQNFICLTIVVFQEARDFPTLKNESI